jgi:4-aminobutyrate aminotransferase-like enzyme/Ser/Thr protein kinase RdoA (MazF antagonist)
MEYQQSQISLSQATNIASRLYGIKGMVDFLPGEIDFNFKVTDNNNTYILKISRPGTDLKYLTFQDELLWHLEKSNPNFEYPKTHTDTNGRRVLEFIDENENIRKVRLIKWIEGPLYSNYSPKCDSLRYTLGYKSGQITAALIDFNHDFSKRSLDWDIANGLWVEKYLHLFDPDEKDIISYFLEKFKSIKSIYSTLRKSTIHNDANDNNIVVSENEVKAIIDYGDAIFSQIINDLSVTMAYACMEFDQPLLAALPIVKGYNAAFPLQENELRVLYTTTAIRLIISVTKSAINKKAEPENLYLQISEKPAWDLLRKWISINDNLAQYAFRSACGFEPCPSNLLFQEYARSTQWDVYNLIPEAKSLKIESLDLSVSSKFVGNFSEYTQTDRLYNRITQRYSHDKTLLVGGYGEARPVYTTDAFKVKSNEGFEHRTIHLGVDFWQEAGLAIHSVEDGEIIGLYDNCLPKDYGPTIILKHQLHNLTFFTLYGHLTKESLQNKTVGQTVKKDEKIAEIGSELENGGWAPHLHFQIILDMLGQQTDFYGVSAPTLWPIFKSICPDPNLLFKAAELNGKPIADSEGQINFRKKHLGKSLSLSYQKPLKIVRGQMQFLIDDLGQKYLDTVNNVAHVGHEHPKVVNAGKSQMGVLNTNTRYLHDEILTFAEALLSTFPAELSVVHFVNSGSEANELAMRMAKAFSGQKDMIALEIGYHGNTQACIDVSSYKFDGKGGSGCPEHTHIVPLPDAFRGLYQGIGAGSKYAKHVKGLIENLKSNGRGVAGIIAESIVSCGGQVDLPEGFLKEAFDYVREAGGVCISDEVQTGFGRVGKEFWGFQLHGVIPDIVTMGKPIGNGHPLAAVVCTRQVADAFANGMEYFNTFGGNPVSCAIGLEVLKTIKEDNLQQNAFEVGAFLKSQLKGLQEIFPILADIRGEGLFLGIELCDIYKNPLAYQTNYLANRMKDFKILMSIDGPQHNVLKIKPPMCFSKSDADYLIEVMKIVLAENDMNL